MTGGVGDGDFCPLQMLSAQRVDAVAGQFVANG
jgi:hypothetical protein